MRLNKSHNHYKNGYTLMEVLIVIVILGIIAAIAIPRFANLQETFREHVDEANAAMIARLVYIYIEKQNLKEVPTWSSLPDDIFDKSIRFNSLKYGGVDRRGIPQIEGTIDEIVISGNDAQLFPR